MVSAVMAAGTIGASANVASDQAACKDRYVWKYCGDHIRLDRPIRFSINHAARPTTVAKGEARAAATNAALEWNRYWPLGARADGCFAVCYKSETTAGTGVDGISTISWGDVSQCPGADPDGVAVACVSVDADGFIDEVDIVLSSTKTWRQPTVDPAAEVAGLIPGLGRDWYDLQSVLTHEFGHAIGLGDIGASRPWPYDLADTGRYQQTMYGFTYRGTTNKRTLAEGDIVGLQEVAVDAAGS